VPAKLKGYVIGFGGSVVKKIQKETGASVVTKPKNEDGFTVTGTEEQRARAKKLISQKVVGCSHLRTQRNSTLLNLLASKNKNSRSITVKTRV